MSEINSRVFITHYFVEHQKEPRPGREGSSAYDVHIGNKALSSVDGPDPVGLKIAEFRARQVSSRMVFVGIANDVRTGASSYETTERIEEVDKDLRERAIRFARSVSSNTGLEFDVKEDIVERTY